VPAETTPFRAEVAQPGMLASVGLRAYALEPITDDEVLISIRACGLNFKDVVVAMALLPDEAWENGQSGAELGMDAAGVAIAVGNNGDPGRPGDAVVGLARHCLGNRGIAHRHHVVKKPANASFVDAAALPTVFLTAMIGLEQLARLGPGETVLIHAA